MIRTTIIFLTFLLLSCANYCYFIESPKELETFKKQLVIAKEKIVSIEFDKKSGMYIVKTK